MTLDQLRYALEVQKHKNFSRAAEACYITQPSLSVQIAKLEDELGLTLFDRTRNSVEVTEYGVAVLKQARLILDEASRISQIVSDLKGEVQGQFRLGIIPTLAPSLLPLFLGEFGRHYPKVQLSIREEPTERLIHDIHDGELDAAILSTPAKSPESILEKVLFYEPFVVFASTGHPILERKSVKAEDISSNEILLLDETHCLRDQVLQLCRSKQMNADQKLRIQSGSLQTLIEVIRRETGYTLLPALSVHCLSNSEKTKNIRHFQKPVPSRKISLVFHRAHLKRSIIEAMKVQILKVLPEDIFTTQSQNLKIVSPHADHFEI